MQPEIAATSQVSIVIRRTVCINRPPYPGFKSVSRYAFSHQGSSHYWLPEAASSSSLQAGQDLATGLLSWNSDMIASNAYSLRLQRKSITIKSNEKQGMQALLTNSCSEDPLFLWRILNANCTMLETDSLPCRGKELQEGFYLPGFASLSILFRSPRLWHRSRDP